MNPSTGSYRFCISALATMVMAVCSACDSIDSTHVVVERVTVSKIEQGRIEVTGRPGAIIGAASTVTLTVRREAAPARAVAHLEHSLPIASGYAVIAPDGGFPEVTLGAIDRPVAPGDELEIVAQAGTSQAGEAAFLTIP